LAAALLEVRGLGKSYPTPDGARLRVLAGLDLSIPAGQILALLGPTGCGKTTLLRLLLGLEEPDAGEIRVLGRSPAPGLVGAGIVFQQPALLPWKRVEENVALPLLLQGTPPREARERARALLARVGLPASGRSWPDELSGGMQQRAALARALARGSPLLLLDEPFSALDDRTRRLLQQTLLELAQEQSLTVLMVTHNIEEALLLGDRVAILGGGRVLLDEPIVLPRPRDPLEAAFTARFLELRRAFAEGRTRTLHK